MCVTGPEEHNSAADTVASASASALLERSSELVELLAEVSSVLELLSQAAQSSLGEQERQVTEHNSQKYE